MPLAELAIWYDVFSLFYDRALEELYEPHRVEAVKALRLDEGAHVLDVPCGTGQSLEQLAPLVGTRGRVIGVDLSGGMLGRANKRASKRGWEHVSLVKASVLDVDAALLSREAGRADVDAVFCALGLTAFSDWERSVEQLFALLRPGGRFVILDVYAETPTRESRSVERVARADLSRRAWEPLERLTDDFERRALPADPKKLGGELYVASGSRPA